jgi:hypothetical protein
VANKESAEPVGRPDRRFGVDCDTSPAPAEPEIGRLASFQRVCIHENGYSGGLTDQTLSCAAKARVPNSSGTAVAASTAEAAMSDLQLP